LRREPAISIRIAEKWADAESLLGFLLGVLLDTDANGALAYIPQSKIVPHNCG
jgi:hypothetical protein